MAGDKAQWIKIAQIKHSGYLNRTGLLDGTCGLRRQRMSCHGLGVLSRKGCWGKESATAEHFQTRVTTKSTYALWGVPCPGPHGHALAFLWPHQHKSGLAGEGTHGAKGEVPVEVEAGSLAHLGTG